MAETSTVNVLLLATISYLTRHDICCMSGLTLRCDKLGHSFDLIGFTFHLMTTACDQIRQYMVCSSSDIVAILRLSAGNLAVKQRSLRSGSRYSFQSRQGLTHVSLRTRRLVRSESTESHLYHTSLACKSPFESVSAQTAQSTTGLIVVASVCYCAAGPGNSMTETREKAPVAVGPAPQTHPSGV